MEFTFETQGTNTYLVYQLSEKDQIDSMSLGMLTNNKIPGLASTLFTQMDTTKFIKYNVSAKISVKQFFNGSVNKKRLIGVFNGVVDAILSSEEYMIDPSSVLLDLDYIFTDVSTCETILICVPLEGYSSGVKLGDFFKSIMFNTQFDQTENCDHVAKLMNYLNSSPAFSLDEFKKVLETINTSSITEVRKVDVPPAADKGGSIQPKVGGGATPLPNAGTVNNGVANQPKVNGGISSPANNVPSGSPIPPAMVNKVQTSNKEKKHGLFSGLFKKDSEKNQVQSSKKPINAGNTPSCPVPGMENGGMAIPGQPDPVADNKPSTVASTNTTSNVGSVKPAAAVSNGNTSTSVTPPVTPRGQAANFGETTVLGGGAIGETTVLTAAQNSSKMIAPHLIRKKNNEKISLNKPVFRVGKERSYVDYFIGDNTAISRSHANIITRDGAYFIVDTNSTNHTFVNGEMIPSNVEVQIDHETKIILANEDFEFKLY